ncbi:LysR family transcriptional regulator [Pseudomonas syringae group genomosp. 3]|uniref:HTH lysR-type domain-containing protein n=1 Tax=Pseudomonas syringae pv. viburni TaxID=251703 RepID=A0A0Q0EQX7_9PSED|nr:LysR family transcriptional regulator [Pseudomonas syringae group genomosp. 3]KPZ13026.1 hypothetical protein ALO40_00066 [Pseudomonas syringae pv. viburni]
MDTLQNMLAFYSVSKAGSFTAAAALLDTTTVNVSRAVSALETHLQTRLLNRTTRRLALTDAGERYLLRCKQILFYIEEAEAEASDAHARPAGQLRVHSMTGIGQHYVIDAIARYRRNHPDVSFDVTMSHRVPDILEEEYDVSIVLANELPDSGFVSQRLGITYSIVCASPDYIKTFGIAYKPADLLDHSCLRLVSPAFPLEKWAFDGPNGRELVTIASSPFSVNSADAMQTAISSGMGLGILPIYSAIEGLRKGALARVLPQYRSHELNVYAIYPSRQYLDAKIRTWVEYLRSSLPDIMAAHEADLRIHSLLG